MGSVFKGIEKLGAAGLGAGSDSGLAAGNPSPRRIHCAATLVPRPLFSQKKSSAPLPCAPDGTTFSPARSPPKTGASIRSIATSLNPFCSTASRCRRLTSYPRCWIVFASADCSICEFTKREPSHGLKQRTALLALGRTRAMEAIPALAAGLDSHLRETRIAAVRGLGRTARMEAAIPILDRIVTGQFDAPERSLKNALVNCCRSHPEVLVNYLEHTHGTGSGVAGTRARRAGLPRTR